jgi:hypothetical protein
MHMRMTLLATTISLASAAVVFADPPRQAAKVRCSDGTQDTAGKQACKRHGGTLSPGRIPTAKLKPRVERDPIASRPRVLCADGTVATKTGRGACSQNGGIAPTTSHVGEPVAVCSDGWVTTPTDHPTTCTQHGGIREWLGG